MIKMNIFVKTKYGLKALSPETSRFVGHISDTREGDTILVIGYGKLEEAKSVVPRHTEIAKRYGKYSRTHECYWGINLRSKCLTRVSIDDCEIL